MKILYVSTISDTINAFLVPHLNFLVKQGNKVGVACQMVEDIHPDLIKIKCKIHSVPFQRNPLNLENINAYKKVKKIIVDEGYDLIHVHTPVASFITRFACRNRKNLKVLYTAHGFHFYKGAPLFNWLIYYPFEKMAAKWTDGIITMNEEDYQAATSFTLRKKNSVYKVQGVGIDTTKFSRPTIKQKIDFRKELGYNSKDFILIYVGEMSYRKHQDMIIDVIGKSKDLIPNMKLLLVGDGDDLEKYKGQTKRMSLDKHIVFLGYRHDVDKLMSVADVAVSTSRQEGLPVNLMEAKAVGLPLIVTNARGNRDLVPANKYGYVIDMDNIDCFSEVVLNLYHSVKLRNTFGENNLKHIKQFSVKVVLGELQGIYAKYGVKTITHEIEVKTTN